MSFTSSDNPKTGFSITGLMLGVIVEISRDNRYTNYRIGVATESMPDKFDQVTQVTNEIELSQQQYERLTHSIQNNKNVPCRIWVEVRHRAGEKNGKVWEIMTLNMRTDSQIEFFNTKPLAPQQNSPVNNTVLPDSVKAAKS